ncbi:hypothetical protein QTP70_022637 [Hemibagrus guttatus]|uniref:Uncharacterized protein n=1 Tax=Hemibagrus guttatus TaxID=175788 RepID=A0AAE0Q2U1_9TELE|nr:hypothetical protein QTP70_022637 [Hemibagrus guttatus]
MRLTLYPEFNDLEGCPKTFGNIVSRPESEHYVKRQAGIFEDTYKQDLMSIEREHSYRKQQRGRQGFR